MEATITPTGDAKMTDPNVLKFKLIAATIEAVTEGGDPSDPDEAEQALELIRQILGLKTK